MSFENWSWMPQVEGFILLSSSVQLQQSTDSPDRLIEKLPRTPDQNKKHGGLRKYDRCK